MPVLKNVDTVRRLISRNVLKTEFQSTAHKIDDQWPFEIAVAIPTNVCDLGSDRAQLVEKPFHANISKMPDFVCILSQFLHAFRQAIVRVRQNKNPHYLIRSFPACHTRAPLPLTCHLRLCPGHVDLCSSGCYVAPRPARHEPKP